MVRPPRRWLTRAGWVLALPAAATAFAVGVSLEVQAGARELEAGVPVRVVLRESDPLPPSCWRRLQDWWRPPWIWTVLEDDQPLPGAAGGVIQDLGRGAFRYTPAMTARARTLVLRVAARQDPRFQAQAAVRVVPPPPLELPGLGPDVAALVRAYAPEVDRAPREAALPYLDPATGQRSRPSVAVAQARGGGIITHDWRHRPDPARVRAGYGIPVRLTWPAAPGAAGQRLSYRAWARGGGASPMRLDVTGCEGIELAFTEAVAACGVESLSPRSGPWQGWSSRLHRGTILVRGLVPLAGNSVVDEAPEVRDGQGVSARFQGPAGLALMGGNPGGGSCPFLVVAEPDAHVVRSVSTRAEVRVLAGMPGVPGYRDGAGCQARFLAPTHVAGRERRVYSVGVHQVIAQRIRECLVADSGNHLIRTVEENGEVATLAGMPDRGPGHRDHADPRQARFNNPQGIATAPDGYVYVADRGNAVIRRIGPDGVITLAGRPGAPGTADGVGEAARFFHLKGLAWDPWEPGLFVIDGHALRRVSRAGQVSTVLGQVAAPGFHDDPQGAAGWPLRPCFRDPCALAVGPGVLFIADTGNHAIRECRPPNWTLRTLAGDPNRPDLGWGLLRDGLEPFPDQGYATLRAPCGLAADFRPGRETLYVASGPALAQIPAVGRPDQHRLRLHPGTIQPLLLDAPCPVEFMVSRGAPDLDPGAGADYHFTVALLEPDGTEAGEPLRGTGTFSVPQRLVGPSFSQEGHGWIQIRCVTLDGVSLGIRKAVPVRKEPDPLCAPSARSTPEPS